MDQSRYRPQSLLLAVLGLALLWLPQCRQTVKPDLHFIEEGNEEKGFYTSTHCVNGTLAVSYHDIGRGSLKLWMDTNRDSIPAKEEIRTIAGGKDIFESVGENSSLHVIGGKLGISYYHFTHRWLWLWYDDNGDFMAQTGENRVIDKGGEDVGWYTSLAEFEGKPAVSYWDAGNGDLKLWVDENGNFAADPGEIRVIDGKDEETGEYTSLAVIEGKLAVSYYDAEAGDLKLWVDLNNNHQADAGEIKTIDGKETDVGWFTSLVVLNGKAAVSYYDRTNGDLKVWVDTDGNFESAPEEIHTVDGKEADVGTWSAMTVYKGKLAASYREGDRFANGSLRLWIDSNGNFDGELWEIRTIDGPAHDVGEHNSITECNGKLAISYRDHTEGNPKLAVVKP